jgi:hypothetical protein
MHPCTVLLLGMILDMGIRGNSICTLELSRLAALASDGLFDIKFFAIHQNMRPAPWVNTYRQKCRLQC